MSDNDRGQLVSHDDLRALTEKANHTDNRVTGMESKLSLVADSVLRIESSILAKPPIWSLPTVLTAIGMVVALMFGMYTISSNQRTSLTAYLDLRMENISDQNLHAQAQMNTFNSDLKVWMKNKDEFQRQGHYEFGIQVTKNDYVEKQLDEVKKAALTLSARTTILEIK